MNDAECVENVKWQIQHILEHMCTTEQKKHNAQQQQQQYTAIFITITVQW